MHRFRILLFAVALAPLSAPAVAQDSSAVAQAAESSGTLRPGDVVRLRIWREPDLSGDFPVDEHGTVILPKLGPVGVLELSTDSLKRRLVADYSTYLRNPAIDVMLLRRINIFGAVRNPGLYPVDPTMTLADAFALAGGVSPDGQPDRVELVRDGQRTKFKISENTRIGDTPVRSGDQLYVPTKGWLARNTWLLAAGLSTTASIIITLLR